jgi:hypothetical protein
VFFPIDRRRDSHGVTDRYILTGTLWATYTDRRRFVSGNVAARGERLAGHVLEIAKGRAFAKLD